MNGAVLLARWSCHDRHPGIEQILAGPRQPGGPTTEDSGKKRLQPLIDSLEGVAEARSGLLVDASNRPFQGLQGLVELGLLRLQIFAPFGLLVVLLDGRQVDRA